ncbi:MAG TPA: ThiF family adenylyltransferase [Ferrovibrio sp.]|uniref:ThiF family adenylyltransferase n=1 Tax=Ferrovibrio sp. TaxID=1917215 RepID=UPI002ED52ABD
MSGEALRAHAQTFVAAAIRHPQCRGARLAQVTDTAACIELDLAVEMPQHMKVDGISESGVRRIETAAVRLGPSYPWSPPTFYLRSDFPRDLPHLQPGAPDALPRPCLIDGNQREYFFQYGLVELGVFHLVHQLIVWLQHAAEGALIAPEQGWEPTLRRDLSHFLVIDAQGCRAMVDRNGGYRVLKATYYRSGPPESGPADGVFSIIEASMDTVPLKRDDKELFTARRSDDAGHGNTVCCVLWPDKLATGAPFVSGTYMPETVTTLAALRQRAADLNCARALDAFLGSVERCFSGYFLERPVPIAIVLCARRPYHLIGSSSDIELLPYVLEVRAMKGRSSLFAAGDEEPVAPAMQLDRTNPALLRSVSGAPETGPVAMLGCGSVGSKMAMHLARCGIEIPLLCDEDTLMPHNMARHALARSPLAAYKAPELAAELSHLGQSPQIHKGDLVADLATREGRQAALPRRAVYAVNTTASLSVREALSALSPKDVKPRLAEAALFGRGHGGFLLVEGAGRNPTLCDLIAELYATTRSDRLRSLLFDPQFGLAEVQIGQGCGSLTMPMTDMRLSAMTAGLTEALVDQMHAAHEGGRIILGATDEASPDTRWHAQNVAPFEVVPIEPMAGWTLRISQRVLDGISTEMGRYPAVETGGVMIGTCSARLKAVTVVDVLAAPPDSVRSAGRFVLGTRGLKKAIRARHRESGDTLFDVGTWHSHLTDQGPSPLDRQTARELAAERPPPSVLLIATPGRLYALMHPPAVP